MHTPRQPTAIADREATCSGPARSDLPRRRDARTADRTVPMGHMSGRSRGTLPRNWPTQGSPLFTDVVRRPVNLPRGIDMSHARWASSEAKSGTTRGSFAEGAGSARLRIRLHAPTGGHAGTPPILAARRKSAARGRASDPPKASTGTTLARSSEAAHSRRECRIVCENLLLSPPLGKSSRMKSSESSPSPAGLPSTSRMAALPLARPGLSCSLEVELDVVLAACDPILAGDSVALDAG